MNAPSATQRTKRTSSFRFDLGIRRLLPEWKALLSPRHLREDSIAGITVACIAIPLSLAIALASGVSPEVGLVTAVVAGVVCALFNGTPLAVSGPAAAMAVLIASAVATHGLGGLLVIGVLVGLMQLLTGVFGLGKLIRFVPVPVVAGFTAGIGAIILVGQLPRALGIEPPADGAVFSVLAHVRDSLHLAQPAAIAVTFGTVAIAMGLPKVAPKLPAPLIAVIVPTVVVAALGLNVELIGALPSSLPAPRLPSLPEGDWLPLFGTAFIVYTLASLETLLSSGAVDKLAKGPRHDPDQELVGQGLGNMAVAMFGGIPVTGVIARSGLNVQAGARTRRAAIVHSVVLIASIYVLAPVMGAIPIAALAGVLISVAMRMLHPAEFKGLWKVARPEAVVYGVTFVVIVGVDLIAGVQAGVLAALAIAAIRFGQTQLAHFDPTLPGPYRYGMNGPITFLSSARLESLGERLADADNGRGIILDMRGITTMDTSGAETFAGMVQSLRGAGSLVALVGLRFEVRELLLQHDHDSTLAACLADSESEAASLVTAEALASARDRLVQGVERFRSEHRVRYKELLDKLAHGQQPHTLFITCADSRIDPNLLTSTEPGELFVVRNVGNIVPHAGAADAANVGSAIEYAIDVLGVTDVVICAHSSCGAMGALLSPPEPGSMPNVESWLRNAEPLIRNLPAGASPNDAARSNALLQLENARSYPSLLQREAAGQLRLHAWYYDMDRAELREWDEAAGRYVTLGRPHEVQPEQVTVPLRPVRSSAS